MPRSIKEKLRYALRLRLALKLVWQAGPRWTIASAALVFVQGILPLASLYLMKLVVDSVTAGIAAPDKAGAFARVLILIGIAGAVQLLIEAVRAAGRLVQEAQSEAVTDHVSDVLHAKSVEVDLEYYEDARYLDTLHRAQREAPYRPTRILGGLVGLGQSTISLCAMAGLLLAFHWGMAVILFLAAIPGLFVRLRYSEKLFRFFRDRTPAERRAWYYNWLLTSERYAKEVRLFDLGRVFIERFHGLRKELRNERIEIARGRTVAEALAGGVALLAVFGAFVFISYRTIQGAITLGDLVMYFQAFQRGQGNMRDIMASLAGLYEDNLFLSHLHEFLGLKRQVREPEHPAPIPRPMREGIAFRNVNFRYPTGTRPVLDDVSLRIEPGRVIALVGENGSGKTTLIKLLCRLYDPTDGSITLDGTDLREFSTVDLRREINVIFQDFAQYHLTAHDNVWFGDVNAPAKDPRIEEAARRAGAHAVIDSLPGGYEAILGRRFEQGEELYTGEWQKVALARAFMRDAQMIVLDEPTSAMDAKAEEEFFSRFRGLIKGQSAVLISHRFSTVRMADRIYVLDRGRVAEEGSHEELMALGGLYAHMFETQAKHYR